MFNVANSSTRPSRLALAALGLCVAGAVALSIVDGLLRRDLQQASPMVLAWVSNFLVLFEQGIYAATLFWVGASFVETRTLLSVGFDWLDAGAMSVKGPDEANTVWIGRRYDAKLEAEAVATALESRIREAQERAGDR